MANISSKWAKASTAASLIAEKVSEKMSDHVWGEGEGEGETAPAMGSSSTSSPNPPGKFTGSCTGNPNAIGAAADEDGPFGSLGDGDGDEVDVNLDCLNLQADTDII
jgi:hypothetical protein